MMEAKITVLTTKQKKNNDCVENSNQKKSRLLKVW